MIRRIKQIKIKHPTFFGAGVLFYIEVDFLTDVAPCNVQSARDLRPAFHPTQEHGLFYGARELGYFDILSFFAILKLEKY